MVQKHYMKHLYKPGYEWEPIGELVDIWYYIRILAYQIGISIKLIRKSEVLLLYNIDYLISSAIKEANHNFRASITGDISPQDLEFSVLYNYSILNRICKLSNLTIDQLTEASWEKLKPGSERGEEWMKAREEVK